MKNNKVIIISIIILILVITLITLFKQKKIDYSEYSFTDTRWERETEEDIEYVIFNSDGTMSYYCACGTPINNNDICDKYTYNDKTKTIKLKCIIKPANTITKIKINKYDENSIELDFDGEIKTFTK